MATIVHRQRKTNQTERNTSNRATGAAFEKRLDGYHKELEITGRARILHTNPKIRMTGPNTAAVVGKGEVDRICFCADGRVIHFDAKSRAGNSFYTQDEHQVAWLRQMAEWGHVAGWVVNWHEHGEVRWHPVSTFSNKVVRTDGVIVSGVDWLEVL